MMRWSKLGRGAERYYLGPVEVGDEPPGWWLGSGAGGLGLGPGAGPVGSNELAAVLSGRHPQDGGRLTPRPTRVAGFDLTCAAPKSVSLLWALAPADVAAEVDRAHVAATEATLGYLERRAVRDGSGAVALVAGGFQHHLSRAADPHLHVHLVVANLRHTGEAGWRALDSPALLAHVPTAGVLFESHLRYELTRRLAVRFGPVVHGVAQLEGVDAEVRAAFSSRLRQVRRGMADHGGSSPRSARIAAIETRAPRRPGYGPDQLREEWCRRALRLGLGPGRVEELTGVPGTGGDEGPPEVEAARVVARMGASSFSRRDVIRAVCGELPGGAPVGAVERVADELLRSGEFVAVARPVPLRAVDVIRPGGRMVPVGTDADRWTTREEAAGQARLAAEAARAVRSGAGIELLSGPPGPARWSALDAARLAWQASGLTVAAVAPDRRGARELESATGIPTGVLADGLPALPPGVLVVSGAEMLGPGDAGVLVDLAAGRRTRVVLVGDPGAVARVDRAGAWRALESAVGAVRLGRPGLGAAPRALRPGAGPAVVTVGERLTLASGQEDLRRRLVDDWLAAAAGGGLAGPAMVAMRRADVDDLNLRAAARVLERGDLGEATARVGPGLLHDGETVLVAGAGRGSGLRPGQRWLLDAGGSVPRLRSPSGALVDLGAAGGADLRRGYAMTPYQARLVAPEAALVLGDPVVYRGSPGPAECPASFYSVADLTPEGWAGGRRRAASLLPSDQRPPMSGRPAQLGAIEEGIERLRRLLSPPPDPSARLAAAEEDRTAALAALARLGPDAPERSMWEARSVRAGERVDAIAAEERGRRRWMADNAAEVGRYAELMAAGAIRRQALARAAELDPPSAVLSLVGPRPEAPGARAAWRQAAGRLLSYRERWGLVADDRPLGPPPADPRQAAELREVSGAVRALTRALGLRPEVGRDRAGSGQAAPTLVPATLAPVPELR